MEEVSQAHSQAGAQLAITVAAYPLAEQVMDDCLRANKIEFELQNLIGTDSGVSYFSGTMKKQFFTFLKDANLWFHLPTQALGYATPRSFQQDGTPIPELLTPPFPMEFQVGKQCPLLRALLHLNPKFYAADPSLLPYIHVEDRALLEKDENKLRRELDTHLLKDSPSLTFDPRTASSRWRRTPLRRTDLANHEMIDVHSPAGENVYSLEVLPLPDGNVAVLPVAFFTYSCDEPAQLRLNLMPSAPYPLWNAASLTEHPTAHVILTDLFELGMLPGNSNENQVVAAFFGGIDAVKDTDFSPVHQRWVSWLLLRRPTDCNENRMYTLALKMALKLNEHGVILDFLRPKHVSWAEKQKFFMRYANVSEWERLTLDDVIIEAKKRKLHVPEELEKADEEILLDWNDIEDTEDLRFIISPLISESSLNLINSGPAIGKTLFCYTLAAALAKGNTDLWDGRWKTTEPRTVLYLDGEMMVTELKKRTPKIKEILGIGREVSKNLIVYSLMENASKRSRPFNLAADYALQDIQKYINRIENNPKDPGRKVSVIFLDNLSCLCLNGENASNFQKVVKTLQVLRARGITIFLVHHFGHEEMRSSGTSMILRAVTADLQLLKVEDDTGAHFMVYNNKWRNLAPGEAKPFIVKYDFVQNRILTREPSKREVAQLRGEKMPVVNFNKMREDEKITAVKEGIKAGLSNKAMAEEYQCSESTIKKFRETHNLRDCDFEDVDSE